MPTRGDIWLGDFWRCVERLGPLDDARTDAVARLLGLDWSRTREALLRAGYATTEPRVEQWAAPGSVQEPEPPPAPLSADPRHAPERPSQRDVRGPAAAEPTRRTPQPTPTTTGSATPRARRRQRLDPIAQRVPELGRPWADFPALERYIAAYHGAPLRHEPLWERRWTRDLVTAALAVRTRGQNLDEARAIEMLASGRSVTELPRVDVRTLSFGAQVLVDVGAGMDPYARDGDPLVDAIRRVVGPDRTSVLRFRGSPLAGAGPGGISTWRPYAPPEARTPVIALTDLGIGGPTHARHPLPREWLALAHGLARRSSRLIALVPYAPHRWEPALERSITILHWDRPTTVAQVLDRVSKSEQR